MDLTGSFDQVLKMGAREEVAQIDKFAVVFILDIYHAPAVLAATNLLPTNDDGFFAPNNGKWNNILAPGSTKVP